MSELVYVYGHSDDLVEIEGYENDEIYAIETPHTFEAVGLSVVAEYDGSWSFEVVSNPNNTAFVILPNHTINRQRYNDYTELLVIDL